MRPSTYENALDDGLRVARAVRSQPLEVATVSMRSLFFGRAAMSLSDDLVRIRVAFGDEVVSGLHAGAVTAQKAFNGASTAAGWLDGLMDEDAPGFRSLDRVADRFTTRAGSSW